MYKVTYKYGNNTKVAFVCADSLEDAKLTLLAQYLVGAIRVTDVSAVNYGTVIYPNGRC